MTLIIADKARSLPRDDGLTVARCNHSSTQMTVAEIKAARAEAIPPDDFTDAIALICERFDREISESIARQFYSTLKQHMGAEEFAAAYNDFWTTEMFFANVIPFFVKHVQRQRENAPDLISLGMAEAYRRGAETND